jgi:SAM-dependent methyltransferase
VTETGGDSDLDRNRREWARLAPQYAVFGRRNWAAEPSWGIWSVPEAELQLLPDVAGMDTLELGCGTAYISAWLARAGARPVGLDPTPEQLATARSLQDEFGLTFPLIEATAEAIPLPDASFDFVVSEYGASIWADPYKWIPEAARVLRPGGQLVFLVNGTLLVLCEEPVEENGPAGDRLLRDYFGMHRFTWPDTESVDYHLGYGDWIRLLRVNDFEVLDLVEIRPPEGATSSYQAVSSEWARRWPSEEVWKARKRG